MYTNAIIPGAVTSRSSFVCIDLEHSCPILCRCLSWYFFEILMFQSIFMRGFYRSPLHLLIVLIGGALKISGRTDLRSSSIGVIQVQIWQLKLPRPYLPPLWCSATLISHMPSKCLYGCNA